MGHFDFFGSVWGEWEKGGDFKGEAGVWAGRRRIQKFSPRRTLFMVSETDSFSNFFACFFLAFKLILRTKFGHILHFETSKANNMLFKTTKNGYLKLLKKNYKRIQRL